MNDLDNAGDFMPILVKTHQTATSAYFRFDFDDSKIRIWKKNGTMTRTNSTDSIQAHHNYSYGDLFAEGAETNFYIQGLDTGQHDIDVVYVLDGSDLWTESLSVTFFEVTSVDEYVPDTYVPLTVNRTVQLTNYFATAKGMSPTLQATIEPAGNDSIAQNLSWEASGITISYPNQPDKKLATISSQTAQEVTLQIKYNNATCWEGVVWFCWGEMQAKMSNTDTLSVGNDCEVLTYTNGVPY